MTNPAITTPETTQWLIPRCVPVTCAFALVMPNKHHGIGMGITVEDCAGIVNWPTTLMNCRGRNVFTVTLYVPCIVSFRWLSIRI